MANVGTLLMTVDADTKKFEKGMSRSNKAMAGLKSAAKTASIAIGAAFVAVSAKAISLAADAEEMQNKFDVTFKTMGSDAEKWAKTYSKSVGRSVNDTKKFLSNIADLQQGLGMTEEESLELSKQIVELGTDLASFNNVNDATAIEAVQKALLGEAESAKQLGLLLNVDRVKAYAEAQGLVWENVTDVQRAQLTYNLAVEQSQNAIGDAERSSGSYTNQMKALKSTLKDVTTSFGKNLLPVITKLVTFVNENLLPSLEFMKNAFKDFYSKIEPFVTVAFEKIQEVAKMLYGIIKNNVTPVFETFSNFIKEAMPVVREVVESAFTRAKDVMETMWAFIKEHVLPIYKQFYDFIVANMPQIRDFIVDAIGKAFKVFDKLWAFIKNYILPIIASLFELVADLVPKIWQIFKPVFENIISLGTTLWKFFENNLLPIIKAIFDTVNEVIPKLSPIFETAFGFIGGVIGGLIDIVKDFINWVDKALEASKKFLGIGAEANPNVATRSESGANVGVRGSGGPVVRGNRANGGSVMGGSSYLVGEKGPEIFTPGTSGGISNGGSNVTININGTQDVDLVMTRVVQELNRQGITGR